MESWNTSFATQGIESENTGAKFKIAHISDTHISPEYNRQNIFKLKDLLGQIVDENYDHVVITGDIAGHAEERDFKSVRRILKYFGLLDYEKLTVTIGNHDVFGGVHRAEDLLSFGNHCRSVNYAEKIVLFEKAFRETFPKKVYESQRVFPFVKIIGPAVFVGINSVRPFHPLFNPFGSNGHVSERQLQAVERILSHPSVEGLAKIALIHHHFNKYKPYSSSIADRLYHVFESQTLKLHERTKVKDAFRKLGVAGALHGHTHLEEIYSSDGIFYSSTALNPIRGKTDMNESPRADRLVFNEIAISESGTITSKKRGILFSDRISSEREGLTQPQHNSTAA
ncbi:MAG TPA: metallophosphoesterase [Candidatus Acidoferrales bacterium]|nr:metallophosphoesterase [Candidatus Acidoferrales bacterium]